ncbi:MAG: CRISPR system precrRNA processing endoribonuclease RAMP protein Cas6 [Thermogutta sp.]
MGFIELCFTAHLDGACSLKLPFLGATLRGALGYALKRISCQVKHGQCNKCVLSQVCPYNCLFEGIPTLNRQIMRKYPTVPQPFVLVVPPVASPLPDGKLTWSVRLFGSACCYWPYLVYAYQRIGEEGLGRDRVRYTLGQVTDSLSDCVVWEGESAIVNEPKLAAIDTRHSLPSGNCALRWVFHTPLKLRLSGKKLTGLDLVLAGRRRYEIMNYFYGSANESAADDEPHFEDQDFVTRDARIKRWDLRRFSGRQKHLVEFFGLLGEIVIEGPWGSCGEWLAAIPTLHLGKATSFGFGQVTWEILS